MVTVPVASPVKVASMDTLTSVMVGRPLRVCRESVNEAVAVSP
jgi:hypothetical protein